MEKITVSTAIDAPIESVWTFFTNPQDVVAWNNASDDWHTPHAENDLRTGGSFCYRMEAKDGSQGFDFEGVYDDVVLHKKIAYTMSDGRKVGVSFAQENGKTVVTESFDPETQNSKEVQRNGWQAILNNFKHYTQVKSAQK